MHLGKASKELRTIDGHFGNYHISFWVIYGPHLDFFVKQDHESDLVIIYSIFFFLKKVIIYSICNNMDSLSFLSCLI
jgi:hypothetical protein